MNALAYDGYFDVVALDHRGYEVLEARDLRWSEALAVCARWTRERPELDVEVFNPDCIGDDCRDGLTTEERDEVDATIWESRP